MAKATCSDSSCGAAIAWGRNISTGKGVPLDAELGEDGAHVPIYDPEGSIVIATDDEAATVDLNPGEYAVRYLRRDEAVDGEAYRMRSHFITCPAADRFRRDAPRKAPAR